MTPFEQQVERMRHIFSGKEEYPGGDKPTEQASRFWWAELLTGVIEQARANSETELAIVAGRKWDLLVSLSGFAPATTVLAYELLRPRRVLIIGSEAASKSINTIYEHLVRPGKLQPADCRFAQCDPTKPDDIYQHVAKVLEQTHPGGRGTAILDITGGKKIMSAAAALAAWQLDMPLCYIDGDQDHELRQPRPGSERLLILPNPTTIFGDQALRTASELFNGGAFDEAHTRYKELSERIAMPDVARFRRDLAALYRAWCDLDFSDALKAKIAAVRDWLPHPQIRLNNEAARRLSKQLTFLDGLVEGTDRSGFLLNFYLLGWHYLKTPKRSDFAAMLFYRTIEGCFTERLTGYGGFDCSSPDYSKLGKPAGELLESYNRIAVELYRRAPAVGLPGTVGCMNGAILLLAIDDPFTKNAGLADPKALSRLRQLVEVRNKSVLAHGFSSVTTQQCEQIRDQAFRLLKAFWAEIHPSSAESLEGHCESLRFLQDL